MTKKDTKSKTTVKSDKKTATKAKKADSKKAPQAPELIIANTQIKLVVPIKDALDSYKKQLNKLAPQVKAEGFRKGKVPPHIAENIIGKINIIDRVLQELVPQIYTDAIKKAGKTPMTAPDIKPVKIEMESDWELVAEIAERPEVKLGDYKKLAKKALKESAKEIKTRGEELKKAAKANDSKKKSDDKKDDKAPAQPTELTDKQKEDVKLSHIFKSLVQEIKPQIQELMLKEKVKAELRRLEEDLKRINMTLEDYLKKQNTTFESLSQQMAVMHLGQIQLEFIFDAIIEAEKLAATEKEIEERVKKVKSELHKEALKEFDDKQYRPYFVNVINREKVTNFLLGL